MCVETSMTINEIRFEIAKSHFLLTIVHCSILWLCLNRNILEWMVVEMVWIGELACESNRNVIK